MKISNRIVNMKISNRIVKLADSSFGEAAGNIVLNTMGGAGAGALVGAAGGSLVAGVGAAPGAIGGALVGGVAGGIRGLYKSLYEVDPPKYTEETKTKIYEILSRFFAGGSETFNVNNGGGGEDLTTSQQDVIVNSVFDKIKTGNLIRATDLAEYFGKELGEDPKNILDKEGLFGTGGIRPLLVVAANDINVGITLPYFIKKEVPQSGDKERRPSRAVAGSCIEDSSAALKSKGFLDSIETSWTPAYDKAFREFVDVATASMGELKTNMVGGESWTDVASRLGQTPDVQGACNAIAGLSKSVASKVSPAQAITEPKKVEKVEAKPDQSSDVLAAILSAMYHEKLVGTPGLDFIREVKRVQSVVGAAGGPVPTGFGNAAKILLKRNPSIGPRLPKSVVPFDKSFAFSNKELFQTIQTTVNGLYDAGVEHNKTLGIFNPNITQSTAAIKEFVSTPAGGNWKFAGQNDPKLVKLADQRKSRIRLAMFDEMTVDDKVAARKTRMKEAAKMSLRLNKIAELKKAAIGMPPTVGRGLNLNKLIIGMPPTVGRGLNRLINGDEKKPQYSELAQTAMSEILSQGTAPAYKDITTNILGDDYYAAARLKSVMQAILDKNPGKFPDVHGPLSVADEEFKAVAAPLIPSIRASLKAKQPVGPVRSVEKLKHNNDAPAEIALNLAKGAVVSDADYTYTGADPESFSWVGKSDRTNNTSGVFKKGSVKPAAWTSAVAAINKLVLIQRSQLTSATTPVAGSGQTPQATTAPAESQTAAPAVDNLTINVARLLSNVNAGHTYAGKTVFKNEMAMVRGMLSAIMKNPNLTQDGKQMVTDAPLALSKIIVGSTRGSLNDTTLARHDPTEVQGMTERDIESTFRGELDIIMRGVATLDKILGGSKGYEGISRYFSVTPATVTPPTTPQPPSTVASAPSEKITRFASLRRMKVRSQMEAAIESSSSAKIGRSRV